MDMRKLVEQTLIEMDDKITSSGFEIITAYDVENAQFQGDANRMYRVVQNVIDNALKYSLKGSRIYIHVQDAGKKWKLSGNEYGGISNGIYRRRDTGTVHERG